MSWRLAVLAAVLRAPPPSSFRFQGRRIHVTVFRREFQICCIFTCCRPAEKGWSPARLKAEPYYRLPPPRSTGRELFNAGYLRAMLAGINPVPAGEDVAATVTRLLVDLLAEAA